MSRRSEPDFWEKLASAWPRRKKSPWGQVADTLVDASAEGVARAVANVGAGAFTLLGAALSRPARVDLFPGLPEDTPKLLALARESMHAYLEARHDDEEFEFRALSCYLQRCKDEEIACLHPAIMDSVHEVFGIFNQIPFDLPDNIFAAAELQSLEGARARDMLRSIVATYAHPEFMADALAFAAAEFFYRLTINLPPIARVAFEDFARGEPADFTVPLIDTLGDPAQAVDDIILPFLFPAFLRTPYFSDIRDQIDRNVHRVSKLPYPSPDTHKQIHPKDFRGSARELVDAYLADTWLRAVFDAPVPFPITAYKKHHWAIYARTGHGKTQLLQTLILSHLKEPDSPAMIVIDSQGQMLKNIENLEMLAETDRLLIVDPRAAPAINMFDLPKLDEDAEIEVLSLYNYIFSAIDADLTSRQGTAFSYVIRLMLATPDATIMTLLELMEENVKRPEESRFWSVIETLDPVAQSYFRNRFFTPVTRQTKEQLATRLYGILRVRAFERMFSARENKLDLHAAIEAKKVVLINTGGLGDASSLFGRYMIARALQAAFQRDIRREPEPALLFVDEAFDLMDENINRILIQARKFGLFLRFATQHYDQIPTAARAAAASNTEVKLAGGLSADDARKLAADFRTDADYLLSIRRSERGASFACFIQNVLERPVKLGIEFGLLEREPARADSARAAARRRALAASAQTSESAHESPDPPDASSDDPTRPAEWE